MQRFVCAKHALKPERVQVPCYNRMNIEEQKKLLAMKRTTRSQLHEGDRLWEGRLWENCQLTNRNLIRGLWSGTRWHNTSKSYHSASQINEAAGQWRFQCLPSEICLALRRMQIGSAQGGNIMSDEAEVSRGHSSWDKTSRGAVTGSKLLSQPNIDTRGAITQ